MYKNEIDRHEQYKKYAKAAYDCDFSGFPKGKIPLYKSENKNNGFSAYSVKDEDRIVIVYAGTDIKSSKDIQNDLNMFGGKVPVQTKDALRFYDQMKEKYPNDKIDVVGHSLGGSLAQYVATQREVNQAVNFNPYGIGKSQQEYLSRYQCKTPADRIINYNNTKDIISNTLSKNTHIGTNYSINTDKTKASFVDPLKHHRVENMESLSKRQKQNPDYNLEDNKYVIKSAPKQSWDRYGNLTGFAADIPNEEKIERYKKENELFSPENRVFYENELNPAKINKDDSNYKYIDKFIEQYWNEDFKMPSEKDLKSKVQSGDLVLCSQLYKG